jgi:hypothetical protein
MLAVVSPGAPALARCAGPPLSNAGAGDDPLVRGVETLGEVGVGDDAVRDVGRHAGDRGPGTAVALGFGHDRICRYI